MSTTETSDATAPASVATVDLELEVVVIPVADVDRSKDFYAGLGWRLDPTSPSTTAFGLCSSRRPARRARSSSARR